MPCDLQPMISELTKGEGGRDNIFINCSKDSALGEMVVLYLSDRIRQVIYLYLSVETNKNQATKKCNDQFHNMATW